MLLHYPYISLAVLGNVELNVELMDPRDGLQPHPAKLAPVSKIAQCVGTLSKKLDHYCLMDLCGC